MPTEDFATVGDNCIDRFLPPIDDCLVGGNAVNVAVQLAMLGRRVHYFGAVGDDAAGRAVSTALAAHCVKIANLRVMADQRTAYTDIEVSEDGDRSFVFEQFGACATYVPSSAEIPILRNMRHVHIGWLNDGGALKRALAGSAVSISQDLSVNNTPDNLSPHGLDIAFTSAEAGEAEQVAARLLGAGARLAVVTLGAAGSLVSNGRRTLTASAMALTPVDTTGAGDAFIAGFLHAHVAGQPLQQALVQGTACAGAACMHRGGFPQIPLKGIIEPWSLPDLTDL
jgi:fructoselysine 6-kinase